jgi:hypothetical protein
MPTNPDESCPPEAGPLPVPDEVVDWENAVRAMTDEEFLALMDEGPDPMAGLL